MRFLLFLSSWALFAQTFEVATVKPNVSGERMVQLQIEPGGRFRAVNATLRMLIEDAYELKPFQTSGAPGWLDSEHFDITAKADDSAPGPKDRDAMLPMLRALLEERFKLSLRKESKEMPIYALVVGKNGPKFQKSEIPMPDPNAPPEPGRKGPMMRMGRGQLSGQGTEIEFLVTALSRNLGRLVIDKTGLTGRYDFKLEWTPDPGQMPSSDVAPVESGPTIFTALQEQLGLKLEAQKGPVDVYVIDHVEKPTAN